MLTEHDDADRMKQEHKVDHPQILRVGQHAQITLPVTCMYDNMMLDILGMMHSRVNEQVEQIEGFLNTATM